MPSAATPSHIVLVGGGIVGLATAHAISRRVPQLRISVLEKESEVGQHQTGHNSGVIHSGLYYAPGSLKAELAVRGAQQLVRFCREHRIKHEICGKVVVATEEAERPRLRQLYERGQSNGLQGLKLISPERLREIEPEASGIEALEVPGTGIVDFKDVACTLAGLISAAGGEVLTSTHLLAGRREGSGWILETNQGIVRADAVINCAGLQCDRVAQALGARPTVRIVPFRGEYYRLRPERESLVRTLIYPVPDPAFPFLGVHFTRMIAGGVEAGPNAVLAWKREGYRKLDFRFRDAAQILTTPGFFKFGARHWRMGLDEAIRSWSKAAFVRALQRLVPVIHDADLVAGGSGVRAQAMAADGSLVADFRIDEAEGALHVLNAPSPAATASLAIGEHIAARAAQLFGF